MSTRINTNVSSIAAQRSFSKINRQMTGSLEKLGSGSRINKAADDAAGLAISEKLKANIRSSKQANRNANDSISLIQTAEGGLNEVSNILTRLRELSVQSSSDTIGDTERSFVDLEFQQLTQEIDRITKSTSFNGNNLLDGSSGVFDFQVGINGDPDSNRISYDSNNTTTSLSELGLEGLNSLTKEQSQDNLGSLDQAIEKVNSNRARLGSIQNRLQSSIQNLEIRTENLSSSNSRIRDTDIAEESANLAKNEILSAANASVLAQANNSGSIALKLIAG
ncbi:MAG: flagellin FliC [Bdellovibrionales bacterium]|jgi:flagellin|nr:flagellin FliC [Bdellovibrionales bacterium]